MANEITGVVQFQCVNGNFNTGQISVQLAITQTAQGAASGLVTVATTNTALPVGTVSTYGFLYLRNLDTTNFVTFGTTLGYEFTLKAGEPFFGRMTAAASLWLKANAASVKVQYLLLND